MFYDLNVRQEMKMQPFASFLSLSPHARAESRGRLSSPRFSSRALNLIEKSKTSIRVALCPLHSPETWAIIRQSI